MIFFDYLLNRLRLKDESDGGGANTFVGGMCRVINKSYENN